MQPRILLPTRGHICPKPSAEHIRFRAFTDFSNGKLRNCRGLRRLHRSSNQYLYYDRLKQSSLLQLYKSGWGEPRYMITVATFVDKRTVHDTAAASLSRHGSAAVNDLSSFTKLPGNTNKSVIRRLPTNQGHLKRNDKRLHISYESQRKLSWSTAALIETWLNSDSRSYRAEIWARHVERRRKISLSSIFLGYLEAMDNRVAGVAAKNPLGTILDISESMALRRTGFSEEDLQLWAHMLTCRNDDDIARHYLSAKTKIPVFVSLQFLRRRHLASKLFRALLIHSRIHLGLSTNSSLPALNLGAEAITLVGLSLSLKATRPTTSNDDHLLDSPTFMVLMSHMLRHARRVLVPAIVTISRMVVSYCHRVAGSAVDCGDVDGSEVNGSEVDVSPEVHKRLCQIYNMMLCRLSLPASVNPMHSMAFNWEAQRIFLASAAGFRPPILIDKSSYHAVSRVLVASKKSAREERYAKLIQRAWPPWRKDLDGTDADRSPEEDITRAVAALTRMKEAGHAEVSSDKALKMLGGREPDWSPTIQTRHLTKFRRITLHARDNAPWNAKSEVEWAARITATRDVYEAWGAFQAFLKSGQRASHSMYHAMCQKLISNTLTDPSRQGRKVLPGDGKEVLPVLDDNLSESEKLRMQPPSLNVLFQRMVDDGIRPSGRLLALLVSKARSLEKVELYFQYGAVPRYTLRKLMSRPSEMDLRALKRIPEGICVAFIEFLSRRKHRFRTHTWLHPTLHALELVRCVKPLSPFVWYLLLRALSRGKERVNEHCDQHMNNILSWRMIELVFAESKTAGVELDPEGFRYICMGLKNALLATPHVSKEASTSVQNGQSLVKEIFATFTDKGDYADGLPSLSHRLTGFQLHGYIQALGLLQDSDEIVHVLEWMAENREELVRVAEQSRNSSVGLRRSLVAIKSFLPDEDKMDEGLLNRLKAMMDNIEWLGGWPTDEEVEHYRRYGSQNYKT